MNEIKMRDEEALFRQLLQQASPVSVPSAARARLTMAVRNIPQIGASQTLTSSSGTVIPFKRKTRRNQLIFGLPLAASFMLGLVMGSNNWLDNIWPSGLSADPGYAATEIDLPSGVDDVENFAVSG